MSEERVLRLHHDLDAFVDALVASGKYPNDSAVVEDALRLLQRSEASEAELDRLLKEGLTSGVAADFDFDEWARRRRAGQPHGKAA